MKTFILPLIVITTLFLTSCTSFPDHPDVAATNFGAQMGLSKNEARRLVDNIRLKSGNEGNIPAAKRSYEYGMAGANTALDVAVNALATGSPLTPDQKATLDTGKTQVAQCLADLKRIPPNDIALGTSATTSSNGDSADWAKLIIEIGKVTIDEWKARKKECLDAAETLKKDKWVPWADLIKR